MRLIGRFVFSCCGRLARVALWFLFRATFELFFVLFARFEVKVEVVPLCVFIFVCFCVCLFFEGGVAIDLVFFLHFILSTICLAIDIIAGLVARYIFLRILINIIPFGFGMCHEFFSSLRLELRASHRGRIIEVQAQVAEMAQSIRVRYK